MQRHAILTLALFSLTAQAAGPAGKADAPPPPPMPAKPAPSTVTADEGIVVPGSDGKSLIVPKGAEIRIVPGKNKVEHQYRVNGRIVMIKVVPRHGKPYYITWPRGYSGPPVRRELDDIQAPAWIIHRW